MNKNPLFLIPFAKLNNSSKFAALEIKESRKQTLRLCAFARDEEKTNFAPLRLCEKNS